MQTRSLGCVMCQCKFINGNKCTWWGMLMMGEAGHGYMCEPGVCGKLLYLTLNFAANLKLL